LGNKRHDEKLKRGGIDPTPTTKLNMWACTIGGGILGYAISWKLATDGVVVDSQYFGLSGSGASL
jgi:hypothetical protein